MSVQFTQQPHSIAKPLAHTETFLMTNFYLLCCLHICQQIPGQPIYHCSPLCHGKFSTGGCGPFFRAASLFQNERFADGLQCKQTCCLTVLCLQKNWHLLAEIWLYLLWHSFWALNLHATFRSVTLPFCALPWLSHNSPLKKSANSAVFPITSVCFSSIWIRGTRNSSCMAKGEAQPSIPAAAVVVQRDIKSTFLLVTKSNQQPWRVSLHPVQPALGLKPHSQSPWGWRAH